MTSDHSSVQGPGWHFYSLPLKQVIGSKLYHLLTTVFIFVITDFLMSVQYRLVLSLIPVPALVLEMCIFLVGSEAKQLLWKLSTFRLFRSSFSLSLPPLLVYSMHFPFVRKGLILVCVMLSVFLLFHCSSNLLEAGTS